MQSLAEDEGSRGGDGAALEQGLEAGLAAEQGRTGTGDQAEGWSAELGNTRGQPCVEVGAAVPVGCRDS